MDDDAIRDLVIRLARPASAGGHTIERATILAEGSHMASILTWIVEHGGTPETAVAPTASGGLHGARRVTAATPVAVPLRYVLPPGSLS